MLQRKNRLNKGFFKEVPQKGSSFHSPFFSVRITPLNDQKPSKWAFIVSKKVSKLAVKRNLLRRRAKATIIPIISTVLPSLAVVVTIKKDSLPIPYSKFKEELLSLLNKATIIK